MFKTSKYIGKYFIGKNPLPHPSIFDDSPYPYDTPPPYTHTQQKKQKQKHDAHIFVAIPPINVRKKSHEVATILLSGIKILRCVYNNKTIASG